MEEKYKKAVCTGVLGLIIMSVLFAAMVYIIGRNEPPGSDSGPAAVGAAMLFVIASLALMVFIGLFSTWWALMGTISIKEAIEVSCMAGAIPTGVLCFIILVFDLMVSFYGPSLEFSITGFLSSGLTICCIGVFFIGIALSVIGGLLHQVVIFLMNMSYNLLH